MLDFTVAYNIRKAKQIVEMSNNLSKFGLIMGDLFDEDIQVKIEKMKQSLGPTLSGGRQLWQHVGVIGEGIIWAELVRVEKDWTCPSNKTTNIKYRFINHKNGLHTYRFPSGFNVKYIDSWLEAAPGDTIYMDEEGKPHLYKMCFIKQDFSKDDLEKIRSLGWKIAIIESAYSVNMIDGNQYEDAYCMLHVEK